MLRIFSKVKSLEFFFFKSATLFWRFWKLLQNAYLVAKFRFDIAENELRKEWCVVANRRRLSPSWAHRAWQPCGQMRPARPAARWVGTPPRTYMLPETAEDYPVPPRSENRGFLQKFLNSFGSPRTPNPSKFLATGYKNLKKSRNSDKFSSKSVF